MRPTIKLAGLFCSATLLFGATAPAEYISALEEYMMQNGFEINGEFYTYDFGNDGRIDYNDWVYVSLDDGKAYRLLAVAPTQENAFGFSQVQKPADLGEPSRYFVQLNFTMDSDSKFSWVYVDRNWGIYKLMGATQDGRFDYLDIDGNGVPDPLPGISFAIQQSTLPGSVAMTISFIPSNGTSSNYSSTSSATSSSWSSESSYSSLSSTTSTLTLPTRYTPNDGRLLAAGCYQCHGTNGYSTNRWDSIAGEDMEEFYNDHPLMRVQAEGYTLDEIRKIFDWLRTLPEHEENEGYEDDEDEERDDD